MALFPDVCRHCKPPKRNPDCHATCVDYLNAKADHAEQVRIEREARKAAEEADSAMFLLKRN